MSCEERKEDHLLFEPMFTGVYQIGKTVEFSASSVLSEGTNQDTGKMVLVRRWFPADVTSAQDQARIQEEVGTFQAVQRPSLLPLLEVGMTRESVYLVSMAVPGETLGAYLSHTFPEPLPLEQAVSIIMQVGQALEALHQHGLCHGNLMPQTIFFSEPDLVFLGEPRLPAVLACLPSYQPALEGSMPLCWYMAPEQFAGEYNAATDQYALGCLAYHLLTGHVPFSGFARTLVFQKHLQEQPRRLRDHAPDLPASIEEAVLKALAKHPAERHASIQALLEALVCSSRGTIADQDTAENVVLDGFAQNAPRMVLPSSSLLTDLLREAKALPSSAPAISMVHLLKRCVNHLRHTHALTVAASILNAITTSTPTATMRHALANGKRRLRSLSRR